MPIDNIKPLQGLNRMYFYNLDNREREQWYRNNAKALAEYDPAKRDKIAAQMYQNQIFIQKFGRDAFNETYGKPGSAAYREKLLRERLVDEEFNKAFRSKHYLSRDPLSYTPVTQNGQPVVLERDDKDVNVTDEWFSKYGQMDTQAKEELLKKYYTGEYEPDSEVEKNNIFSKSAKWFRTLLTPVAKLSADIFGGDSKNTEQTESAKDVLSAVTSMTGLGALNEINELVGEGRHFYNKAKRQSVLDKIYDESNKRLESSEAVTRLKNKAYLDNSIVGANDEETKAIWRKTIKPDVDNGNLGIPEYYAYFGDSDEETMSEVQDISIDKMREIIATKYAMEQAGVPKDRVRDVLNREAERHVAENEPWYKTANKFKKAVAIAACAYTADKINGAYNVYLMAKDAADGGVDVWMDNDGNIIDPNRVQIVNDIWDSRQKRYNKVPGQGVAIYMDDKGNDQIVHKSKINRSALLLMGREPEGKDAGAERSSALNSDYWTKAEQYNVWGLDEIHKWEKIGASPNAVAWDPDDTSHILYDSFKMMSFGLADQALMLIPDGAGQIAKGMSATTKVGAATQKTLGLLSKMGSSTKYGQAFNNALASLGIGYAYNRSYAYEEFSKNLMNAEKLLQTKSEQEINAKYGSDKDYKDSIDNTVAQQSQVILQEILAENADAINNGEVAFDYEELQKYAERQAWQQVYQDEVQKQMEANKEDPEYQELIRTSINNVAYTGNIMQVTDALKYFSVGAFGHRKYIYENPTGLLKQTKNTFKEGIKGAKSYLKDIQEVKNAEGKLRLSTNVGEHFTGFKNQAKQLGKVTGQQFVGGAWTNGTDDMQVDGVQKIDEDIMQRAYNSYVEGKPTATVYGVLDQVSSFMTGMGESLGQPTTWDVTLIGGLGGTISGNVNFVNLASYATKSGREAFREQYGTKYERDASGNIIYDEVPLVDKDGEPVKNQNGEVQTQQVPRKRKLKWYQNLPEKAGFFIQNGVLNTYYGNKQAALSKVDRVHTANNMLDEFGDFEDLENYLTVTAEGENITSEREKRTASFLKALRLAEAIEQVGRDANGEADAGNPLLASTLYQRAKNFLEKANSMEVYDTGVNIGKFTPEEVEEVLKEWYSRHPQEVRSQSKDVEALRSIAENAKELTQAQEAHAEAAAHVAKSERQSNKTFSSHVKNKMIEDYVLYNHWQKRRDKLVSETGDTSSYDRELSPEEFIASVGGYTNAESLVEAYDDLINTEKEDNKDIDKNVEESGKKLEAARKKYEKAKTIDEKQEAEKELKEAYTEHDKNLANQEYFHGYLDRLEEKKAQAAKALTETKDVYASELQEDISGLDSNKQKEAISRARNLALTQKKIEQLNNKRKGDKQSFTPSESRELARLKKKEQVDKKWLRNNMNLDNSQVQQFVEKVDKVHSLNKQHRVLTANEIMSLDPVTRSKMLDPYNRRLYSDEQLKEIYKLYADLNMKDPTILEKLHDIARLGQQMDRVMDSYKRLSQHPEGAALAIETDKQIAARAAYTLIDRRFAKNVANFIKDFDDNIIVNSTDETNDIVSAVRKYRDRTITSLGFRRFQDAWNKVFEQARWQGKKPKVTQRDKENAVFQLLRTLNGRILDILDKEQLIEKYRTELDKARRWVGVVEDINNILDDAILDEQKRRELDAFIFQLTFFCDDKEDIMRQLEIEANSPTKPEFTADILNLLDDLEELGHLRNSVVYLRNKEKYKKLFAQKAAAKKKVKDSVNKALAMDSQDDLEEFLENIPESTRKAIESILANSKERKLNDDESRYIIDNKTYARVTSIKYFLKGLIGKWFDKNGPWAMPSSLVGNSLDVFGRDVFNGVYDGMTKEERLRAFSRYDNSTPENYEQVFQALKQFQESLNSNNQRIIKLGNSITDQGSAVAAGVVTVRMPDGTEKTIRIAGSLDVLAVDNQGNIHIYDFKTYHSRSFDIVSARSKGYDKQLSMYAKLLEEEYGIKVASINVIPVHVKYPTPNGAVIRGNVVRNGAVYKKSGSAANQLLIKENGSSSFKEFREADFDVKDAFPLVRLNRDDLTVDYSSLDARGKAEVDKLLAEQEKKEQNQNIQQVQPEAAPVVNDNQNIVSDDLEVVDLGNGQVDVEQQQSGPENIQQPVMQIETKGTLNEREVTGKYTVETDDEGFVHVVFIGNGNSRRSVVLDNLGITRQQAYGREGEYVKSSTWKQIPVDSPIFITGMMIDPDGMVIIDTIWGTIEGDAAKTIMTRLFPELKDYIKQQDIQNDNLLNKDTTDVFGTVVQKIEELVQKISDSTRGKRQLDRGVSELRDAVYSKDPIKIANALVRFVANTSKMEQTQDIKSINNLVNYILDQLKDAGWEVDYMIGKPYNDGMKVIATFTEDESLPEGTQVIDKVIKPQVLKNGVRVQSATVNVRQNLSATDDLAIDKTSHVNAMSLLNTMGEQVNNITDQKAKDAVNRQIKDLKAAIGKGDPLELLNIIQRARNVIKKTNQTEATKAISDVIEKLYESMVVAGYEIIDLVGQDFNEGMPFEAQFVPDDTLEPGQRIITGVSQPQIDKDGVMVQAPKITVRQNLEKSLARNIGEPEALGQRILIRSSVERSGEETGDHVAFGEQGSDLHRKSLDPRTIARANDRDKHKVGNNVYLVENANGTTTIARGPVGGRGGAYGVVIWRRLTSVEKDKIVSLLEKDIPAVDADASLAQEIDDILHGKSRTLLAVPSYASTRSWAESQRGAAERMYHGAKVLTGEWLQTDLMLLKLAQDAGIIKNISLIEINPDNHALAITEADWEEAVEQLQKLGINSPRELAEIKPDTFDKRARRKAVVQAEKAAREKRTNPAQQRLDAARQRLKELKIIVETVDTLPNDGWYSMMSQEEQNAIAEYYAAKEALETPQKPVEESNVSDNPDDNFVIYVTSRGWDREGNLQDWSRRIADIRSWDDGWGNHNNMTYYKWSIPGRGGDNVTIWFRNEPTDAQKTEIENLSNTENDIPKFKKKLLDILKGKQTPIDKPQASVSENEETPSESDTDIHSDSDNAWVESEENNFKEAADTGGFVDYDNNSTSLDDANKDLDENPSAPSPAEDESISPLSANANPVYYNSLRPNSQIPEATALPKEGRLVKQKGRNPNDQKNTFQALLDTFGVKLQNIIDEEIYPIFSRRPDTPVKFMAVNWVNEQNPNDSKLSMTCFLVVDYDSHVKRFHKKENGGVFKIQGKEYLLVGTLGGGKFGTGSRREVLYNSIFGRPTNVGTPQETPFGFVKRAAARFFQNPENNGERFYVAKNEEGEFYSTEYTAGSLTPGWLVKMLEDQTKAQKRPLSELLFGENRDITNPYGFGWDTLDFGIAEYSKFWSTMDENQILEMNPEKRGKNAGRAFVLIPASNGKYVPAYIQTTHYSELTSEVDREGKNVELTPIKSDSPLARTIDELLDQLLARNYSDRVTAVKKLYKYLYLSKGNNIGNNNFLLDKHANIIRILKDGVIIKEFNLDSEDFDRQEFKDFVRLKMNPRINITPATLSDSKALQEYDASGALLTDLAMLRTAGSNFSVWPVGMDNKVLKPNEPFNQHRTEEEISRGTQVPYMGQYYTKDNNGVYRDQIGNEVVDQSVIDDLEVNKKVNDSKLQPEKVTGNKATYILDQSLDNPLVVDIDRNTYKVTRYKTEDAVKVIQDAIAKREQEARDRAAQDALEDNTVPPKPETPEQSRERELKELEESEYQITFDAIKDLSVEDIQFLIDDNIKLLNDNQFSILDEESKALLNGQLRAYYDELERRNQHQDQKPGQIESIKHTGINQTPSSVGTITFLELIGNKTHLGRFREALKNLKKLSDAPKERTALIDYLRSNNINVDAIENTEEGIDAWFETINCRFGG